MAWEVAVAGTLHRDDITTPHGRVSALGGSALYFALAAARSVAVHVCGIAGADTRDEYRRLLAGLPIRLDGLAGSTRPTCVWHVEHDFERWVTASEWSEPGCDAEWEGRLAPAAAAAPVLFLGSMEPRLQLLAAAGSAASLVGADTMTSFLRDDPAGVRAVLAAADLLFLNAAELEALSGETDWRRAASALLRSGERLRGVVVKRGPRGAACVTASGVVEAPAAAVPRVVDPTGAGDALAGGFLGWCAAHQSGAESDSDLSAALAAGAACAALAIQAFGPAGLLPPAGEPGPADV